VRNKQRSPSSNGDRYSPDFEEASQNSGKSHLLPQLDQITEEKEWSKQTPFGDSQDGSEIQRFGKQSQTTGKHGSGKKGPEFMPAAKSKRQVSFPAQKGPSMAQIKSMHQASMAKVNKFKSKNTYHVEQINRKKEEVFRYKQESARKLSERRSQALVSS